MNTYFRRWSHHRSLTLQTWKSLLIRDPSDSDAFWSIWNQSKPGPREQIGEIAKLRSRPVLGFDRAAA
jgi:hypothetical protein